MAKDISLMGASYSDVPAVVLPQTGGGTARFDDASVTTATASDVAQGKVFLASDGTITTGTGTGGLTDDVKTALLNCFEHVAWIDDQGQTYYDELYNALHDGLDSISAVYTQTKTVYATDSLDVLRSDLVVTATYGDGTTRTVTAYTLSGTLVVGTNTVSVIYGNYTTTFNVTAVAKPLYDWNFKNSLIDTQSGIEAQLIHGDGYSSPSRGNTGVVFNGQAQAVRLFDTTYSIDNLLNKTIQVDVDAYSPAVSTTHVRLVNVDNARTSARWNSGFIFRNGNGWAIYGDSAWSNTFSGMTSRTSVSGHTLSLYIDNDRFIKVYVDGQSKGVSSVPLAEQTVGLQIGNTDKADYGGAFYNATVSGVRIYNGDIPTNPSAN